VDSRGSGLGPVVGCCECCDEPSGSGATDLVRSVNSMSILQVRRCLLIGRPQGIIRNVLSYRFIFFGNSPHLLPEEATRRYFVSSAFLC
jgi:hypothetical protein